MVHIEEPQHIEEPDRALAVFQEIAAGASFFLLDNGPDYRHDRKDDQQHHGKFYEMKRISKPFRR